MMERVLKLEVGTTFGMVCGSLKTSSFYVLFEIAIFDTLSLVQ